MPLTFETDCAGALEAAKKAVPEGAELDAGVLLRAVFHHGALAAEFPELAPFLLPVEALRSELPSKVPLAAGLRPVFQSLAAAERPVSLHALFRAVLESPAGREALLELGAPERATARQPVAGGANGAGGPTSAWRNGTTRTAALQALSSYGRTLTDTEPPHGSIVERDDALHSLIRTLSKMKRRNAIVVGPAGCGKTALIYELARRIYRGDASLPPQLRDLDIFEMSPTFLRSGASMVGQYEERVKGLLKVLQANPKIILFVDEIHSLFQAGIYDRGPFTDANESIKAALGHGEITCLGCTTSAEYRRYIEPDKALERRFGIIRLEAPTPAATTAILKARRPRMEEYFAPLRIEDDILEQVVALGEEYLPSRNQPDKSIQLLDEACAYCITSDPRPATVRREDLLKAVEDVVGHGVVRQEALDEARVLQQLKTKIVGQDEALQEIARAFVAGFGGWTRTKGPRRVFLFGGPTGVGKTETALLLSKIIGGGKDCLIRVDCNTLQGDGHDASPAINRLLGVPAGYVGYARGQGGLLSRIRDLPQCVVLFDEFEKAAAGVGELLLQIIDDGRVEDVDGNVLDFRRAFVIFTTNAGASQAVARLGFKSDGTSSSIPEVDRLAVERGLRQRGLGDEFIARVNHVVMFKGLTVDATRIILGRQLEGLRRTSLTKGLDLVWEPDLIDHLVRDWQPRFGVRFAQNILRNRLGEQLDVAEARGEMSDVRRICLRVGSRSEPVRAGSEESPEAWLAGVRRFREDDTLVIELQ